MSFIITDDKNYYLTNRMTVTKSLNNAGVWKTQNKALNYLQNAPSEIRNKYCFKVAPLSVEGDLDFDKYEAIIDEFRDSLLKIESTYLNSSSRCDFLNKRLQELDMQVVDLEHAIELNDLNVVAGYNLYKRLKGVLIERRKCKDELGKARSIKGHLSPLSASSILKSLEGLDSREYSPRVLTDLFDNGKENGFG